jgi:hypothetical protein
MQRNVTKPWVIEDLFDSVVAQSVRWLSLDHPVYEISSFQSPSLRYLMSLDLNLFGKNLVSDLLSTSAIIRSFSEHEFITDDTCSKVVNRI